MKQKRKYKRTLRFISPQEVRILRDSMSLSVGEFADLVGVCKQTICNWEDNVSIPEIDSQRKLFQLMGKDPDAEFAKPPLDIPPLSRPPANKKDTRKFVYNGEVLYFPKEEGGD